MDDARLVAVSDEDENAFSEHHENKNTIKKTLYDLKIFKEFFVLTFLTHANEFWIHISIWETDHLPLP